jgi:hypothetical protein
MLLLQVVVFGSSGCIQSENDERTKGGPLRMFPPIFQARQQFRANEMLLELHSILMSVPAV